MTPKQRLASAAGAGLIAGVVASWIISVVFSREFGIHDLFLVVTTTAILVFMMWAFDDVKRK
jgi:high-affinity Fe2+/Pb2+ permease